MHIFGSPSKVRVWGELPPAAGHSWVPTLPAAAAVVGGAAVVVVLELDLALPLPLLLRAPVRRARTTTTPPIATKTAMRRRVCRCFWARRIASWRDWRPSRCRCRVSVGTAGQGGREARRRGRP